MRYDPPPDTCDHCRQRGAGWRLVEGGDQRVRLQDGREVTRRGRVYVCLACGHTVPVSSPGIS